MRKIIALMLVLFGLGQLAEAQTVNYRNHAEATDISFFLVENDGISPATGVVCAAGDALLQIDGAASANAGSCFTERGNGWYNIALTAAETTGQDIQLAVNDQDATPAWLATGVLIETVGADASGARHEDAAGGAGLTTADIDDIADAVWGEDISTYPVSTAARTLDDVSTKTDASFLQSSVWGATASLYNSAGSMGELLNSGGGGAGGSCDPAGVAQAVGDLVIDQQTGITWQEHESLAGAILYGRTSNLGLTFHTHDNGATRVQSTVDLDRNRTSITVSPSP